MKKALALTALVSLSLAGAQKTAMIGWSGAITGPTSDAGSSYAAGIEDYCKYATAQNMTPGIKLNCVVRDDQYNNANTQRNFEDYVGNMNASIFLGYSTGGTLQLKSTIQETKIPTLPGSYHIGNIDGANSDYIFLPISSYSEQLISLVEWVSKKERGAKVALVVNPSPFGRAPVDDVKKAAQRLGVNIVDVQEVGGNNLDNTALLKRFEQAGVKYVINQNTAAPVANILKDAKRLNLLGKMQFMGAHYAGGEDLTKLAGDAANNFIWATSYFMYDEADKASGIALVKKIGAEYGRKADTIRSVHYTSGMLAASIAIEAIKRSKDPSPAGVLKGILSMTGSKAFNPGFTVGPVSFSAKDHVGAESLRLLQADSTGNFKAITGAQRSAMFKLVHPN